MSARKPAASRLRLQRANLGAKYSTPGITIVITINILILILRTTYYVLRTTYY